MATKKLKYRVEVAHATGTDVRQVTSTSKASACRQVFRMLIRDGVIKNTPPTLKGGDWDGVKCTVL